MYDFNSGVASENKRLDTTDALSAAHHRMGAVEVFAFSGIIDAKAGQILCGLPDLVECQTVEFDFGGIKRINSMGIALLLRCFKRIKEEKSARLHAKNLNQINTMLFKMTGVFQLVKPIEADNAKAAAAETEIFGNREEIHEAQYPDSLGD